MIGEFPFFLGIQIFQLPKGICTSQSKYLKEMVKIFGMSKCSLFCKPIMTSCKLNKDDESPSIDSICYRSMIGSFLYLTTSILDITKEVRMVSRFQSNQPDEG